MKWEVAMLLKVIDKREGNASLPGGFRTPLSVRRLSRSFFYTSPRVSQVTPRTTRSFWGRVAWTSPKTHLDSEIKPASAGWPENHASK